MLVASVLHAFLAGGALSLVAGFLDFFSFALPLAMLLLSAAIGFFLFMGALSLRAVPSTSPSISGFKWALAALLIVLILGLLLSGGLAGYWSVPMLLLTQLHVNWGLAAWGVGLLSSVAYVVVPMFQLTPSYPPLFSRFFGGVLTALVALVSIVSI